jgi:hypothetical protein
VSILSDIKQIIGAEPGFTGFDIDIISAINTTMLSLQQLGVIEDDGFVYPTDGTEWTDLIGTDKNLNAVINYVALKVKLLFDPPTTSFSIENIKNVIEELEFRMNIQVDNGIGGT